MKQKPSIMWLLVGALALAGIVPLGIVAAQSVTPLQLLTGLGTVVLIAGGVGYWLSQQIKQPVQQLSTTARQIEASLDAAESTMPPLSPTISSIKELADLAEAFEHTVQVLQQRTVELNSIYAMGQVITAKVDFEQTVEAVLAAVQQVVIFDAAEVSVLRDDKLVVEAWVGQKDFNDTTGREYRPGRGPTGMIAATKQSVLVSTIVGNEEDMKRTLGYESAASEFLVKTHKVVINSFLGIPLLIGDRLVGTLTLVHREPGRFTEDDKRKLNKLAAQASIAIDNAIQVHERERALQEQIRELRVEVDQAKIKQEVDEITGTDYFQNLQAHAAKMRERVYTRGKSRSKSDDSDSKASGEENNV